MILVILVLPFCYYSIGELLVQPGQPVKLRIPGIERRVVTQWEGNRPAV